MVRKFFGPGICSAIHGAVTALGPHLVPTNLALKHVYDYLPIYVDPEAIHLSLRVGAWRGQGAKRSMWSWLQTWYEQGDSLKNVRSHVTRNFHGRFVAGGDWDTKAEPLGLLPVVVQLFQEGRAPEETDEYQRHLENIKAGRFAWTRGCRNVDELDEYYAELIRTYRDIRSKGYRTQRELGENGADEIRVCIDRQGNLCLLGGGSHRLSMAKLLELDRVPVLLKRAHATWVDSWKDRTGTSDPAEAIRCGVANLESRAGTPGTELRTTRRPASG